MIDDIGKHDVPAADSALNEVMTQAIGNKTDTATYSADAVSSMMRYVKALITAGVAISGAVNDAGPAITDFDTNLAEATDNHYNGMLLMFIDGPNIGQAHIIDDYAGAAKNVSFLAGDQWTDVPVNGNSFVILPALGSLLRAIHAVPAADAATNVFVRDIIGNKTDTALQAATAADSIMRYIKGLLLGQSRQLFSMDFWSDPQEEVPVGDGVAGATEALPSVVVADLPAGATIVRAVAMFKFRVIENTNVAANKLNGATVGTTSQVIQVDDSGATGYVDAINFVDDQFGMAASTREGGDLLIGSIDIAARVDGNDTYSLRWLLARADSDFLNFNDVVTGIRIHYSV